MEHPLISPFPMLQNVPSPEELTPSSPHQLTRFCFQKSEGSPFQDYSSNLDATNPIPETQSDTAIDTDFLLTEITEIGVNSFSPGFPVVCGDSDHESIVSDISEMAEPIKEHLANMHVLQEAELSLCSARGFPSGGLPRHRLLMRRNPAESDAEFHQRLQRKMNFLSLAQEFAELKKTNAEALPFNLHELKSQQQITGDDSGNFPPNQNPIDSLAEELSIAVLEESESRTSDVCDSGIAFSTDASVDNSSLRSESATEDNYPDLVRDLCDETSTECGASISVQSQHHSGRSSTHHVGHTMVIESGRCGPSVTENIESPSGHSHCSPCSTHYDDRRLQYLRQQRDRENIRLRLVLGSDAADATDDVMSLNSRISSSANLASCRESTASLRVCYVNQSAFDDDDDEDLYPVDSEVDKLTIDCSGDKFDDADCGIRLRPDLIANTLSSRQQPHTPSQSMQAQLGRPATGFCNPFSDRPSDDVCRSKQHDAELVAWKMSRFDQMSLERLGVGQLQIIVNDQLNRIEALNITLMEHLVERDDLHRTQDSLLVDLEDLMRFVNKATAVVAETSQTL